MGGGYRRRFSEERILNKITIDGLVPLEYCFTINDGLTGWDANEQGFVLYFDGDDDLYHACVDYMKSRTPTNFKSLDELQKWAHDNQWPCLDAFDENIADWRRRLES